MEYTEKDLKIMALEESIGNLVKDYEGRIAELRVQVTLLTQEIQRFREEKKDDVPEKEEV